jgi:hypothetical protein
VADTDYVVTVPIEEETVETLEGSGWTRSSGTR